MAAFISTVDHISVKVPDSICFSRLLLSGDLPRLTSDMALVCEMVDEHQSQNTDNAYATALVSARVHSLTCTHNPPSPNTANSPIFCLCGNLSLPTTGIGSIQTAQSSTMPMMLVEKKWSSASVHFPDAVMSQ